MTLKTTKLRDAISFAIVSGATAFAGTGVAFAQESDSEQATTLDRIEVTGSRIKRAEIEGALPVTVIDRAQLEASGDISVADFLRDTSFNSFGSFQANSGYSGSDTTTEISLRGLGAGRTLILIDGRRASTNPATGSSQNLNAIPMSAVERIEILTDGASAVYGSDALGGVINIITRKDFEGVELSYGIGRPSNPGGDWEEMGVLYGASGDRGRLLAGASSTSRDVIFTRDRDYWYQTPGASTFSNNMHVQPGASAGNALLHPEFGRAVPGDCTNGTNLFWTSGSGTGTTCQYDHAAISANLTGMKTLALFVRGDYQINDNWLTYFSADVTRLEGFGRFAPVPSSPWPGGAIVLPVGSPNHPSTSPEDGGLNPYWDDPYYQTGVVNVRTGTDENGDPIFTPFPIATSNVYLLHRFAALGPRDSSTTTNTYNFMGGFQGTVGKVDLDFGARYSLYTGTSLGQNYVVAGLGQAPITSGAYNIYDPFQGDPNGLGITATISQEQETSVKEFYGLASFDLWEMASGPVSMVVGAEYRDEYYQNIYDPLSASGQIVGSAGNSSMGGRDVTSAFFEVLFPIHSTFEVNLAGRYDRYSDYGNDFSPKISARWHPIDSLTLRASYGEGFRAPPLSILARMTAFSAAGTTDPATCEALTGNPTCSTQVTTYSIANPFLSSEQSEQWSAGVVWDAADWLSMSVDYYSIEITNAITSITLGTVVGCLRGTVTFCPDGLSVFPQGTVLPNESLGLGAQFGGNGQPLTTNAIVNAQTGFANLGYVNASGFDFAARTNFDLGWGTLNSRLTVSYSEELSSNGGANAVGTHGYPRIKANLTNVLSTGDWDFNWNVNYTDSYPDQAFGTGRIPSWVIHNVQANYKAPWNATVTVGVTNLTDKAPADAWAAGTGYDFFLYNPWGRIPYLRYTQRF